jgi:hypothetical protein
MGAMELGPYNSGNELPCNRAFFLPTVAHAPEQFIASKRASRPVAREELHLEAQKMICVECGQEM